jgi:hypothetical protein
VGAEVDEVGQVGAAAVGPVVDVVGVQEAPPVAAGEAADRVAAPQRAPERRRHAARSAADRQGPSVALEDAHQAGVAAEPAGGLGVQRAAVLELAAAVAVAVFVAGEGGGVDVHHHLVAVPGAALGRWRGQQRLRHQHQRVSVRHRRPLTRRQRVAAAIAAVAVGVPDMGCSSGSASRARVRAVLPRLPVAGRPRLVAPIRAGPVPAMGRFIGSASRPTVAQRVAAGLERRQHQRPLLGRQPRPQ